MNEQADHAEPSKAGLGADELEAKRISRRAAIKKAAMVGGLVWVTPVIDSMVSPAGAVGTVTGTNRLQFAVGAGGLTAQTPDNVNACLPTNWATTTNGTAAGDGVTGTGTNTSANVSFTIAAAKPCTFSVASTAHSISGECGTTGVLSGGNKTITFTPTNTNTKKLDLIRLIVVCT